MRKIKWGLLSLTAAFTLLTACSNKEEAFFESANGEKIDHIHGTGYIGEPAEPILATHNGLLKYEDGKWLKTTKNNNDYMGFQAVKNGFFSSGHPEEGSDLKNPLGLVKSTDEGKTIKKLAFYGETDFHYLGASYNTGTVYAINVEPNSKLDVGLFYSKSEGKKWTQSKLKGLNSNSIGGLAVHPSKDNIIAINTKEGIYYSDDYGDNFNFISTKEMVPSLTFTGDSILYSSIENNKVILHEKNIANKEDKKIPLPALESENFIQYIAINHEDPKEMVVITPMNDIYLTKNGGEKWSHIAKKGKTE
ncbi:sialidase [Peribacillus cavernae]|uniref:Sialidase n=1 Tax=Peribacillus cavernae TaxID=1674310 RepID=A0A3S0VHB5_9BACI|nr:sialidase [Peribacillus cavernae]MDQ0219994.1 photosystem II stability/assembly factor-like uncharacterized protein [Peribacillus cavernae]RUQ32059.1 sialidase [Peribacillus cavernae]